MSQPVRLGVVMDPIAAIHYAKDSTLAMLLAAQARGWSLFYMEQRDLSLRDGVARARLRPLTVKADPRVKVSAAALQRQFELARKVEAQQLQVSTALGRAQKLLDALDARMAAAGTLRGPLAAALATASNISGTRPHADRVPFPAVPPLRSDSLRAIAYDLQGLESAVDGADASPSPDARTSYSKLSRMLTATLAQWQRFERTDVPKLNERLRAAGQKTL